MFDIIKRCKNQNELKHLEQRTYSYLEQYKTFRVGQALYNQACKIFGTDLICKMNHDCFYLDDKIDEFLIELDIMITIGIKSNARN